MCFPFECKRISAHEIIVLVVVVVVVESIILLIIIIDDPVESTPAHFCSTV